MKTIFLRWSRQPDRVFPGHSSSLNIHFRTVLGLTMRVGLTCELKVALLLRNLVLLNEVWTCSDCAWVFKASGSPIGNIDEMKAN
jgi:hypothetical protein